MEEDVLTTSQAARLLGISVRTAQLLIEGGGLTTWKTPGGHRRVFREEVLALIGKAKKQLALPSARVMLVVSPERLPLYEGLPSAVKGCSFDIVSSPNTAFFALGSRLPAAVVVDLEGERMGPSSFIAELLAIPALGATHVIEVGGGEAPASERDASRAHLRVGAPERLPAVLHALLSDETEFTLPADDAPFPVAANERQRLAALERSGLVDTAPEEVFDRLTWLASHALAAPIALMTLLTPTRQWFKSRRGMELRETPRSWAFCNYTLLQNDVTVFEDLEHDERFAGNPAVTGAPHLRFYAGAPIFDPDGFALGSICIMDYKTRSLDDDGARHLRILAAIASDQLRLRATDRQLRGAMEAISQKPWH